MSASNAKGILTGATRQLQDRWQQTRRDWRDRKATDFSETYLEPLAHDVQAALRVIDELDILLQRIHADCE
jgi:hypothetical protein